MKASKRLIIVNRELVFWGMENEFILPFSISVSFDRKTARRIAFAIMLRAWYYIVCAFVSLWGFWIIIVHSSAILNDWEWPLYFTSLITLFNPIYAYKATVRSYSKWSPGEDCITYTFTTAGIEIQKGQYIHAEYGWPTARYHLEMASYLFMFVSGTQAVVVPRKALTPTQVAFLMEKFPPKRSFRRKAPR